MSHAVELLQLGRCSYAEAREIQIARRDAVAAGDARQALILVEHEAVVTLGRRGDRAGILSGEGLSAAGIAVVETERGGNVTFHGPGQLVVYPILDLRHWGSDLRRYVQSLEQVAVETLGAFGVEAWGDSTQHGVYTARGKIASIGIHVTRWVTMHGLALNVDPDMGHWGLIAPCNLPNVEATSMASELPEAPPMAEVEGEFAGRFADCFGVKLVRSPAPQVSV